MSTQNTIDQRMREQALEIFHAGLKAVDPVEAVCRYVKVTDETLSIGERSFDLKKFDRTFIVGAGKAVAPMAKALEPRFFSIFTSKKIPHESAG